ncbi:ABC transporter ATP-binding protein [Aquitalea sp.]|uniref:ABC transporter ATP-binding protein n=1 Tax=Aquitalea sp. TaxID=1872623 RepID=UPI0025894FCB|nr:ABC transporter ATP-binding protein [Aquitalea sp.]
MSSDIAIKVENLSKCFHIYDKPRDRLKQFIMPRLRKVFGRSYKPYNREFWALKDVNFEIKKGETVGIVGRNGSGKSTLLQLICGTLSPTSGNIQTNGRIAALLELGSGFNPEFTGRENVYLNGAILGISYEEIDNLFDEIILFSEIGQFIDQPVKTYSSGMVVRLAFAIAINVCPQILIVDEALSVGDELFQRKCFSRIESLRNDGVTVLFVSHSAATVVDLCDRAILLDSGEFLASGEPKKILGTYQKLIYAPNERHQSVRNEIIQGNYITPTSTRKNSVKNEDDVLLISNNSTKLDGICSEFFDISIESTSKINYESLGAFIYDVTISNLNNEQVNNITRGNFYRYVYKVRFDKSVTNVIFGMLIKSISGIELGGAVTAASKQESLSLVNAGDVYKVTFEFLCCFNPAVYFLNAGVLGDVNEVQTYLHRVIDIAAFRVNPEPLLKTTGTVDISCNSLICLEKN